MTTIAHPTRATDDDRAAFVHAAALALRADARLVSVHAGDDPEVASRMPDAAPLFARWAPDRAAPPHDRRVHPCCEDDPSEGVLDALREVRPDLVVAATHRRGPFARIFDESYAEAIAGNVDVPTLLIPEGARGFVAEGSGELDLHRVLVPVGDAVEAATAVRSARWLLELARVERVEVVLLRVGAPAPDLALPERAGWRWIWKTVADGTLEEAVEGETDDACVVVMATRGHDSIGDVVVGSHTERVLRRASCPVLSVPVR